MEPFLSEPNNRIVATLEHLKKELASIRAGRANPSLIEELPVEAYGGVMKMMEVGSITAPQPSLLTIQVWDATLIKAVEKAILSSSLGLNPSNDGAVIRLSIPPLSEERRLEFTKLANQKGEETRVAIRQIRGDMRDAWQKTKEAGEIGEDELARREKQLQDLVDKSMTQVEELVKAKAEELMQV